MLDKPTPEDRRTATIASADGPISAAGAPIADWPPGARRIDSHALLKGSRELRIRHGDAEYRLRETRAGKLILTK